MLIRNSLPRIALATLLAPALGAVAFAQTAPAAASFAEDVFPALRPLLLNTVSQSPEMILERISLTQAEIGIEQSKSAFMPNVSLSSNYHLGRSATADNQNIFGATGPATNSDGFGYGISISQSI